MTEMRAPTGSKKNVNLATFYIGNALCAMDILQIQEINKLMQMTRVPQAPEYVLGIINLRGQIVTIIDLGLKLGLGKTDISHDSQNIVVHSSGEYVGLLVQKVNDVVSADMDTIELAPANMRGVQGKYFSGVYKTENSLIGILHVDKVLSIEE